MPPDNTRFARDTRYPPYKYRIFVDVTIRRVRDQAEVTHVDTAGYPAHDEEDVGGPIFMWSEGNYSCDCNRHLFFERAYGNEPDLDEHGCSDGAYVVTAPAWLAAACRR